MIKNQGYSNLRKGRYSEPDYVYHVVFSTKSRKPVFEDFKSARFLIGLFKKDEELGTTKTLSFVVMPDHAHWLVKLESQTLSKAVQRIKSMFSRYYGEKVWEEGFYDQGIRDEGSLRNVARYIVANPLRADLVSQIGDYPHWDAVWL